VRLRPPTLADVDAISAAADADPSTMRETGETERERLLKRIERKPTLEDDGFLGLVIEHDGRTVGEIQARAPRHGMPPGGCESSPCSPESPRPGLGREPVALFRATSWTPARRGRRRLDKGRLAVLERWLRLPGARGYASADWP
jgi:hypothetical protein